MTDRELMKQALDALEESVDTVHQISESDWRHPIPTRKTQLDGIKNLVEQHKAAITALKERLANCDRCGKKIGGEGDIHTCTPTQQEPVATVQCINGITIGYLEVMQPVGTKLYTTLPEAQRKPQYDKTEMNCFVQNLYDEKMREGKHGHYETMFHCVHQAIARVTPHAAQREWVGLTNEERDYIWNKSSGDVLIATEAKLKEKNT
jgi:hypothetical protein